MQMQFHMPTQVLMETDCVHHNAAAFCELGSKALIVTGRVSAKSNGSLADVTATLSANGQQWVVFDQVQSNPTIASAYAGAALARAEKVDFVIGIGGGSPMDAAKAISLLACQDIPEENLFTGTYGTAALPALMIPTTAGTGSEVTQYAVLTNDKAQTKTSIGSPILFPAYALLDARYMLGLPRQGTIHTAVDALSHSVEGMMTIRATPFSDAIAIESIRRIAQCFPALRSGSLALADRENLLYASMLGGIVVAHTKTTSVHAMGYSLTYFKNMDHGLANGLLLAGFMGFVAKEKPDLITRILEPMGLSDLSALNELMAELLGTPAKLTAAEITQFTEITARSKSVVNSQVIPTTHDIQAIYQSVLGT